MIIVRQVMITENSNLNLALSVGLFLLPWVVFIYVHIFLLNSGCS